MTTILHIKSSSNLQGSMTRQVGPKVVEALKAAHPGATVIERDLIKDPVPHITPAFLGGMFSGKPDAPGLALSNLLIDELLASDRLVIEIPMYNFSIPSVLKAWIDHVVRGGRTFQYGAEGPKGLALNKKAVLVFGRGGVYSEGPMKVMDHQEPYLRSILGFIGIRDVECIYVEGVAMGPDKAATALETAIKRAGEISKSAA